MASTYSTNLKIELQATGENSGTWGTITNTNLGTALEQAIVGYGNPSYASDANLTLTYTDTNAAQAARALVLNVTSAVSLTATRELVVPTIQKQYIVQNNTTGSQSITVKTSAGTGITVPNGRKAHLYVDGTNVIYMDDYVDINGGAIDGTPIGASSASTGAFTTLSASGNFTLSGGTANGVLYLDGSKVATSGSALTFDGTKLSVIDSTRASAVIADSAGRTLRLQGPDASANPATVGTSTNHDLLLEAGSSAGGLNVMRFATGGTEKMRLDSSGNLGIGTSTANKSSSSTALTVNTGTAANYSAVEWSSNNTLNYHINANDSAIYHVAAGTRPWIVYTNGSERLRIDSSGNVGIGTASPATKTEIYGTAAANNLALRITNTATDGYSTIQLRDANAGIYRNGSAQGSYAGNNSLNLITVSTHPIGFSTNNALRAIIDSSGNVGIGTASPATKFNVYGDTNAAVQARVTNNNAGASASSLFTFGNNADAYIGYVGCVSSAGVAANGVYLGSRIASPVVISTNDAERMRIDSSGNLGIGGTASSFSKFEVTGTLPTSSNTTQTIRQSGTLPSGSTSESYGYVNVLNTAAASFTCAGYSHYFAFQSALGAGSAVTNQFGFHAGSTLTGATNNYGFYSDIASGSNRWNFYAAGTARNYFAGDTGVGRSPSYRLDVEQTADTPTARIFSNQAGFLSSNQAVLFIDVNNGTANSTASFSIIADYNGTEQFKVRNDGTIYAQNTTVQSISDNRVKENVRTATEGLSVIDALRPVRFDFKNGFGNNRKNQLGFVAQEVEAVFPDAVDVMGDKDENGDPYKSVGPAALIPVLVKAIQELSARLAALEAK